MKPVEAALRPGNERRVFASTGLAGRREARLALTAALASTLYLSSGMAAGPPALVLNEANAPPYSTAERTGFFDVVAIEAFRRAGLELHIVTVPAGRSLLLSSSGVSDGELNRTSVVAKLFPDLIPVPEKVGDMQFAAFGKDGSIPGNFEAFRGRSVGLIRGWRIYEQALAGNKDVIAASGPEQLFRLLQLDRIEVALWERLMGRAYIRAHAMSAVRDLEPVLFVHEEFIYLHKRHATHVSAVAAALRAMKQDGAYQRAYREKLQPYDEAGSQ
jgi:polar amino acid transport system substrate-binding protein